MAGALNPRNEGSTPPQRASTKNAHSPWSAQRERKRRSKPVAAGLAQVNEAELEFSPPKRHHGERTGGRGAWAWPRAAVCRQAAV